MLIDTELETGYNLSLENAKELIKEAEGLAIFERYSRAYTLYQFAIEEVGKCVILYQSILDYYNGETITEEYLNNKGFRSHKIKTKKSIQVILYAILLAERGGLDLSSVKNDLIDQYNDVAISNDLKNQSLYVCLAETSFVSPGLSITKEIVDCISSDASLRVGAIQPYLQPLESMKEIAVGLKKIIDNPEETKKINEELGL